MIQLHHAKRTETVEEAVKKKPKKTSYTYSHIVYPPEGGSGETIVWEKTVVQGDRHTLNDSVLEFLKGKVSVGYFRKPRLALPLYLEMKKTLPPGSFSITDLERGLARLLRSGGPLMRTSIDTQYHYHEWHEIFRADSSDHPRLVEIWEASVRTTHHFLREEDISFFLPSANSGILSTLEVYGIRNRASTIMGFIGMAANTIKMLLIDPDYAKRGLGAFLTSQAVKLKKKPLYVDVNDQNDAAIAFYERMGFKQTGHSKRDAADRPSPVIHMEQPENQEDEGEEDV